MGDRRSTIIILLVPVTMAPACLGGGSKRDGGLADSAISDGVPSDKAPPDGTPSGGKLFAEEGGEDIAVDEQGNVYLAAGHILVFEPSGKQIDTIKVPQRPISIVFGGKDKKTLFITARSSLYSVRTKFGGQ